MEEGVEAGSKVIVNIGKFILLGNSPATTSSRLFKSIEAGDT